MQLENGWIVGVRRVVSPHSDRRPDDETPSLLVIHNISLPPGEFGGPHIDRLFTGTLDPADHPYFADIHQLRVSAHCLIRRDGEIVQYVPFDRRAWHAGVSLYRGREKCNDFSIGIELEGTDLLAYEPQQYRSLQAVTALLARHYPGLADNITGHSDIAPGRKTDPGPAFDWKRYLASLEQRDGADNAMLGKRKRERNRE
ncbi:1,6-anhydro-N-acetylmuramyl-L-alanine amidase AmpD [Serratia entomophila]|jgi:AmpD protein|uniref:1,6-anhydro-N-acetylmuramyl-L-alanine amidase AmpD n=1 Tax=Serratia entomophila TaxID=42906 RepID=A0ABY5CUS0_9GAMM|nr:1,6-anhydro-N-acetylmuramyl-L-alanine amidase AmpD [Serratia entomophila]UIW19024.1 1,6-anhydro-N-acetylmuramyl-L-alanine amidase AmpD [Serratia entomophila]USV01684.1 1,6-anhydro-N-acetylmuramyl-L-alanine amidase AmpD [Serratia entomophila]CAI0731908.1 1,6-anhydro-N-acetylmuramyl-L-alanine amidase AmpD [Serratia entomophila]CAI0777899.1 1,6-anhydro-N-acetylmuramyl-L-alanine amidase AmpD [Serratia entomophila]CAI0781973.1 1,6-anhydro-N-acetylmuramyl-L-alanine amidase AmpD [Serratia entomoph